MAARNNTMEEIAGNIVVQWGALGLLLAALIFHAINDHKTIKRKDEQIMQILRRIAKVENGGGHG